MRELNDDGLELTAEQDAEAQRIRERLGPVVLEEMTKMARGLALSITAPWDVGNQAEGRVNDASLLWRIKPPGRRSTHTTH